MKRIGISPNATASRAATTMAARAVSTTITARSPSVRAEARTHDNSSQATMARMSVKVAPAAASRPSRRGPTAWRNTTPRITPYM
jgi:hypothetical protein